MNKGDVVAALAKSEGMTTAAADRAVNALFGPKGIIVQGLKTGEKKVTITGFGTFEMRHRKARAGTNPQTQKPIRVAARDIPGFRAGSSFKDAVPGKPKAAAKKPAAKKPASKPKGKGKGKGKGK